MTSCGGTADRLAVHCASTLNLSNRKPSAANAAVRGVGASPATLSSPARQPTFATDEPPDARLSAVHIPFLIFVRLQCQPWIRIEPPRLGQLEP